MQKLLNYHRIATSKIKKKRTKVFYYNLKHTITCILLLIIQSTILMLVRSFVCLSIFLLNCNRRLMNYLKVYNLNKKNLIKFRKSIDLSLLSFLSKKKKYHLNISVPFKPNKYYYIVHNYLTAKSAIQNLTKKK